MRVNVCKRVPARGFQNEIKLWEEIIELTHHGRTRLWPEKRRKPVFMHATRVKYGGLRCY